MVKIYFSFIKNYNCSDEDFNWFDNKRLDYVKSITDNKRKVQSVYVWRLLMCALKKDFPSVKGGFLCKDGKWQHESKSINFSLAHSNDVVCVAVSEKNVGVDVEMVSEKVSKLKKIFPYQNDLDSLTVKWTEKESLFKAVRGNHFYTKKIYDANKNAYYVTACSDENSVEFVFIELD